MKTQDKQLEKNSNDIKPFRTASLMVNRVCGLKCPHCDIPEHYIGGRKMLSPERWVEVIRTLDKKLDLELVAVSAREPLMPGATRKKTLKALQTAKELGKIAGIVTNGLYLINALSDFHSSGIILDYLDVSLEGPKEIDARVRGPKHFDRVMAAISDKRLMQVTNKFFISFTLNAWNCSPDILHTFIDWMIETFDKPRIAVLLLYPNVNVPQDLWLKDEQFIEALEIFLKASPGFADIFIDAFPGCMPGFHNIIEKGYLPGNDELLRDNTGMLWGYIGENLYVRYENMPDLMRYQVRITPEGRLIMPRDLEKADYAHYAGASVLSGKFEEDLDNTLKKANAVNVKADPACADQRCFSACRGENFRCNFIRREQ